LSRDESGARPTRLESQAFQKRTDRARPGPDGSCVTDDEAFGLDRPGELGYTKNSKQVVIPSVTGGRVWPTDREQIEWEEPDMGRVARILLAAGLVLGFGMAAFNQASADVVADIIKRGELRVAVQTQGPPVSFVDKNGVRTGFAVEVIKMMAKDMGVELKMLDYDWKGLIPAVRSGKADFLAADMTPNAKRTLVLSFTEPYLYSDAVLYAKKSKPFVN